jgi:hypothetical protein
MVNEELERTELLPGLVSTRESTSFRLCSGRVREVSAREVGLVEDRAHGKAAEREEEYKMIEGMGELKKKKGRVELTSMENETVEEVGEKGTIRGMRELIMYAQ